MDDYFGGAGYDPNFGGFDGGGYNEITQYGNWGGIGDYNGSGATNDANNYSFDNYNADPSNYLSGANQDGYFDQFQGSGSPYEEGNGASMYQQNMQMIDARNQSYASSYDSFDYGGGGYGEPSASSYESYAPSYDYTGTDSGDYSGMGYSEGYRPSDNYGGADYSSGASSDGYRASDNYGPSETESMAERYLKPRNLLKAASGFLPGPLGMAAKLGLAATDKNPNAAIGKMAGSTIGGMLGQALIPIPGLGAMLGSKVGGWLADQATGGDTGGRADSGGDGSGGVEGSNGTMTANDMSTQNPNQMAFPGGFNPMFGMGGQRPQMQRGGSDMGRMGTGLAGLYQGQQAAGNIRQAVDANKQQADFARTQADSLAAMYGQNSPYAQELRQQLERKDAAGGRRSQYGPREVELQAKLASMQAQTAPQALAYNKQAMDANKQGLDYRNQGNVVQGRQIGQVGSLADIAGSQGVMEAANRGLSGIFNSRSPQSMPMPESPGFRPSQNYGGEVDSPMPESPGYRPSANYGETAPTGNNFWDSW